MTVIRYLFIVYQYINIVLRYIQEKVVYMKVLGSPSISSKIKFLLDAVWIIGCIGVGIWLLVATFLLSNQFTCSNPEKCLSRATVDGVGFKMDSTLDPLRSTDGATAFFSEGVGKLTIKGSLHKTTVVAIVIEGAILGVFFLLAIWQLRKLFRTFVHESPFTEDNSRTLKVIALSILAMSVLSSVFSILNAFLLNQQFSGPNIHLVSKSDLSLTAVFAAAVIFILAEIFRLGSKLEAETAHTV